MLLVLLIAAPVGAQTADPAVLAPTLVQKMADADFAGVVATFDDKMRAALPEEKLRLTWNSVIAQSGALRRQDSPRVETRGEYRVVIIGCEFERLRADVQMVFDRATRVAGLSIRPAAPTTPFVDAPYVDRSSFAEREVTVDAGGWPLPGTLTLPNGAGPWPAVIMVHGSGPSDRDGTVGPNKIYRDLAHALGSRGIAVLRYEKRTKQHAAKVSALPNFTVKEETVDDAVAAVALLRNTPGIDPARVLVAGHSLGGMLAPRIAAAGGSGVRGLIILAGAVRSLEQSIVDQTRYIALLDGTISPEEQQQIDALQQMATSIKAIKPNDPPISTGPYAAPASYFVDLRGYDPPAEAARLSLPMLILQGGRDYQVTMDDFAKWKVTLASRTNVTFKDFPALNHLFIAGTGPSSPVEYMGSPGHVAPDVIDAIVGWVATMP